ncbi:hypothetical protein [Maridesulfovibrio ferrireducens]|uniref:hypothetical protein n=1 Tax=Maridesulfovibrio ferrireducens TaxID=246191 RepID=UPI001A26F862|nr:hypothetical protein [Maridesulfovibrio ferrireducens]MBI9109954.1 hypothetical protein [Maridesulfovibrio ferrireducens]
MFESKIDNRYLWSGLIFMVSASILNVFLIHYLSIASMVCSLLGTVCIICDYVKLKRDNHPKPHWIWMIILPVYIWKRCNLLKIDKKMFWTSIASLCLWIVLSSVTFMGVAKNQVAASSIPIVTEIVQRFNPDIRCMKVELKDEVAPSFYKGIATLNNAGEINITVEVKKDGQLYVQLAE